MKKPHRNNTLCYLSLALLLFTPMAIAESPEVLSLRGDNPIEAQSTTPSMMKWAKDGEPIPRQFVLQPPLIPHSIKGYNINLKFNKCLLCHSQNNYQESGATMVSPSHFSTRDNKALTTLAPRRYFCTQCHVPQVNVRPLVGNDYQPAITKHP
jgi:nitrate reductase (cytochrome), electron transfer subunit